MKYEIKRRLIIGITLFLLLAFYLFKNISTYLRVFGFILGLIIFYLADHMFELDFKLRHYYYAIIILAGGILLSPLYFYSSIYDKIVHFVNPIFGCILIFYIADKQKLNLQWKLLITFMFVISFLAFHEIGEYLMDQLWDMKLQGVFIRDISGSEKLNPIMSQIDDTMIDMVLGTLGALLFVVMKTAVYFWKKLRKS